MKSIRIGCIADDFTGASDAASFLTNGGMRTIMLIWPHTEVVSTENFDAVVISLKTRSVEPEIAVSQSLAAVEWLLKCGAEKIYFKYCSTFDSTTKGNIGPVCDALLDRLGLNYTLLCPSLLSNGRSVRNGELFVNGVPLSESHMRNHPLNPMWSSDLRVLMEAQSKYSCFVVSEAEYSKPDCLEERIQTLKQTYDHFYLIPDYYEPEHGESIVRQLSALPFISGGSGLLGEMAKALNLAHYEKSFRDTNNSTLGRVMFAGSCSDATRHQVKKWKAYGGRSVMITAEDALRGKKAAEELSLLYIENPNEDILFYSSGSSDAASVDTSNKNTASAIERLLSAIAFEIFHKCAPSRLISAGGETSGAIITALGLSAFIIGESFAPGVPIIESMDADGMRLVLKSGNFGDEDFFIRALN